MDAETDKPLHAVSTYSAAGAMMTPQIFTSVDSYYKARRPGLLS